MEWNPIPIVYYCILLSILSWFHGTMGNGYTMRMFHKLSDEAKLVMQERTGNDLEWWPQKGSSEYYRGLIMHDKFRHSGRRELLESSDSTLAFDPSNATYGIGGLHYTFMSIGTPNTTFLVAIDTGSDLLWVPCQCKQCALTDGSAYGFLGDFNFSIYSPSNSSTSTVVPCGSNVCKNTKSATNCIGNTSCPYIVNYGDGSISTSGFLVEDTVYLVSGKQDRNLTAANIVFGCGQVQTGILAQGFLPDGLLGLGMENVSVPSILANNGVVKDSFSLCFGNDDIGTLIFGDKGSPNMSTTPFQLTESKDRYVLLLETLIVSNETLQVPSMVLFDSGTAITRFTSPEYEIITESFNKALNLKRINLSGSPFEYCWEISNDTKLPLLTMEFYGGNRFTTEPYIFFVNKFNPTVTTCLYVLKNTISIIGYNFMVGYRWIYDREKMILGWQDSDCSDLNEELANAPSPSPIVMPPLITPTTHSPTIKSPPGVDVSPSMQPLTLPSTLSPIPSRISSFVQRKIIVASFTIFLLFIHWIMI